MSGLERLEGGRARCAAAYEKSPDGHDARDSGTAEKALTLPHRDGVGIKSTSAHYTGSTRLSESAIRIPCHRLIDDQEQFSQQWARYGPT